MNNQNGNDDSLPLDPELVKEYLLENPGFFDSFPELPLQLRVSHAERGTISLVDRQQQLLRDKITHLQDEITLLMSYAKENERIFNAYGNLYIELFSCENLAQLDATLRRVMHDELSLNTIAIKLFDIDKDNALFAERDSFKPLMQHRLSRHEHYFGRLSEQEQNLLFGHDDIASAAVLVLGDEQPTGLLAFASQDATHFSPDMDTLLVSQLRKLLTHLINRLNAQNSANSSQSA